MSIEAVYIDHMGSDLTVVDSARVSFNKESDWEVVDGEKVLSKQDESLIYYLARGLSSKDFDALAVAISHMQPEDIKKELIRFKRTATHFAPFTHCIVTMKEKVPIFVARQRFKHTVGFTYSEVSRRYVKDDPEFYSPMRWRRQADNIKQGSGEEITGLVSYSLEEEYNSLLKNSGEYYRELVNIRGVSAEQARAILPQATMTEYRVTGSLYAWANAYNQRSDPHAQKEIQELARQWGETMKELFPVSWKALTE